MANQRPRQRMRNFGNPWIDSMRCLATHHQPRETHSLHLSASACLRKSTNCRARRARSTPSAVFKWPASFSTGMAAPCYRSIPGTPDSTRWEKEVSLWMTKSRPQDFPKTLFVSSCSRMWWETHNWCLVVRAGHCQCTTQVPSGLSCQLCAPPPAKCSAANSWHLWPSIRGWSAQIERHRCLGILQPPWPHALLPFPFAWGWWWAGLGVQKAQLPCLKGRHALWHNLLFGAPGRCCLSIHSPIGATYEPFLNKSLVLESLTQSPLPGEPDLREQASIRWIFLKGIKLCWIK